jgi:hypothetical protein
MAANDDEHAALVNKHAQLPRDHGVVETVFKNKPGDIRRTARLNRIKEELQNLDTRTALHDAQQDALRGP